VTTYCITGVSGYVGRLLAAKLLEQPGARVVGVDQTPPAGLDGARFHRCDIRDPRLADILRDEAVDTLIHLAFYTAPEGDAALAESVNVGGTRNVLEAAGAAGVKRLVLASSTAAYGSHPDNPVPMREDAPLRPNRAFYYSWHKAEQERLAAEFQQGHPAVKVAVLRPCVLIGPHINNPTGASLRQKILVYIKGDATPIQMIHEDDAVEAFRLAATGEAVGIFNVAGGKTLTYPDIARTLGKKIVLLPFGLLAALATLGKWLRVSPVSATTLQFIRHPIVADGSKFAAAFGFVPQYSVHQALEDFAGITPSSH